MRLVCCSIIVMSLALTIASEAEVNLDNAVGIWLLDEGVGQVAKDSSANGNDGELIKKPKWVDGKLGKSLEFDGTNYINCGHDESFNLTDEISIIAWAKMKDPTDRQDIIAKDFAGGTNSWQMFAKHRSGKPRGLIIVDHGGWKAVVADADIDTDDDKWHHYALTYSATDGVARNYIDGKLKGKGEAPKKNKILVTETDVHIGQKSNNACQFKGSIDEVAVFSVALDKDDINLIVDKGLEGTLSVDPNRKLATTWAALKR